MNLLNFEAPLAQCYNSGLPRGGPGSNKGLTGWCTRSTITPRAKHCIQMGERIGLVGVSDVVVFELPAQEINKRY